MSKLNKGGSSGGFSDVGHSQTSGCGSMFIMAIIIITIGALAMICQQNAYDQKWKEDKQIYEGDK